MRHKMIRKLIESVQKNGIKYTIINGPYYLAFFIQQAVSPFCHNLMRKLLDHNEDRYWRALDGEHIGVLGRGPSLKNIHELEFIDTFIITNNFELGDETVRSTLKSKELIQFVNIAEPTLSIQDYYLFNFIGYQLQTTEGKSGWRGQRQARGIPEFFGFNPKYLPEEMVPILRQDFDGINTTGLFAVLYAAEVSNADHIYTAGIDFYDSGLTTYLTSNIPEKSKRKELQSRSSDMKKDMSLIAELYPQKDFHVITQSSYEPEIHNIHIYHRGIKPGNG